MDERQAQITEGAGLEDSRINTEFIDFLSKWSTPFFMVLLVLAAGMFGYKRLEQRRIDGIDQAYAEYELIVSSGNPSPGSLAGLAQDHMDTRSVGLMAQLNLGDLYFNAARIGVDSGAVYDPITGEPDPDYVLTPELIEARLASAGKAYGDVLTKAEADGRPVIAISAAFGSASVLASLGETAEAKAMYERAGSIATAAGFSVLEQVAANRAANIESLPVITLYSQADLPELPTNDPVLDVITNPGENPGDLNDEVPAGIAPLEDQDAASTPEAEGDEDASEAATEAEGAGEVSTDAETPETDVDSAQTESGESSTGEAAPAEDDQPTDEQEPPTEGDGSDQP